MKVLFFSDTHGSSVSLERAVELEGRFGLDLVCISGDFSSGQACYEPLFDYLRDRGIACAFVSGNCESRDLCRRISRTYPAEYLDYRQECFDGLLIAGIAGYDIFSAERAANIEAFIASGVDFKGAGYRVLLTHEPAFPWEYHGRTVGSAGVSRFLESFPFDVVASGHLHESEVRLEPSRQGTARLNAGRGGCLLEIDISRRCFGVLA